MAQRRAQIALDLKAYAAQIPRQMDVLEKELQDLDKQEAEHLTQISLWRGQVARGKINKYAAERRIRLETKDFEEVRTLKDNTRDEIERRQKLRDRNADARRRMEVANKRKAEHEERDRLDVEAKKRRHDSAGCNDDNEDDVRAAEQALKEWDHPRVGYERRLPKKIERVRRFGQ